MRLWLTTLTLAAVFVLTAGSSAWSQAEEAYSPNATNWCGTQIVFEEKAAKDPGIADPDACTSFGICDDPAERATWIPADSQEFTYIRMVIHILRNSDGSNPISTEAEVQAQVDHLNADFAQARIQFEYTLNYVNSDQWRVLSEGEINQMKLATAIQPDSQLNVWVTTVDYGYSFGTFPWDSDALTARGGIVMGHFHWTGGINSVFAHEVGHCLGLYHTFHGVEEVSSCGPCYETPVAANRDVLGDRCDDTPPGPIVRVCGNASGVDGCSGAPWGDTQPENYMAYTPQGCYNLFTPKQRGRMLCWSDDRLSGWIVGVTFDGGPRLGPAPLTVSFTSETAKTVNLWTWDFGDGETSNEAQPTHEYTTPGYHTVSVEIDTPEGPYVTTIPGMISVYADTIRPAAVTGSTGQPVGVDIEVTNYVPVKEMLIPLDWTGPLGLDFDSISVTGLRTDYFETASVINFDASRDRMAILLRSSLLDTQPYLEPGNGPVVTVWFTLSGTGSNPILIEDYLDKALNFVVAEGEYVPVRESADVVGSCCQGTVGNVDGDFTGQVDVGDLTWLINFLFNDGLAPFCPAEANIDGDPQGQIDIGDLSALIQFVFGGGTLNDCL